MINSLLLMYTLSLNIVSEENSQVKVLELGTRALGRLAQGSAVYTAVFVDFEVKRALEWLRVGQYDSQCYAAALILKDMALHAATLFYPHINVFFEYIWTALVHPKEKIRVTGSVALRHALRLIAQRESKRHTKWYDKLYKRARAQFPRMGKGWESVTGTPEGFDNMNMDVDYHSLNGKTSPTGSGSKFSSIKRALSPKRPKSPTFDTYNRYQKSFSLPLSPKSNAAYQRDIGVVTANAAFIHGALLIFFELLGECTYDVSNFR